MNLGLIILFSPIKEKLMVFPTAAIPQTG